ncbi:MAG: hypothetical protein OCC45_10730 [Desulfotalea sp.]
MKKLINLVGLVLMMYLLCSCSDSENNNEKGIIETQTDKVAQEAVDSIKIPINSAQSAVDAMNKSIEREKPVQE